MRVTRVPTLPCGAREIALLHLAALTPSSLNPPPQNLGAMGETWDFQQFEDGNGLRFSWNTWPATKTEAQRVVVPISCLYTRASAPRAELHAGSATPTMRTLSMLVL